LPAALKAWAAPTGLDVAIDWQLHGQLPDRMRLALIEDGIVVQPDLPVTFSGRAPHLTNSRSQ
jgi:hypothetical protein